MKNKIAALLLALSTMGFAKEVNVKILGTSDVHGRVVPWSYASDTEDKSGSYAQLSTLINQRRKENKNVILVEVGDSIQDNSIDLFALTLEDAKNHPIPKVLNYMKYDVFVSGNHEFNFGMPVLNEILNDIKAKKLAANLYHKDGKRYLQPTTIIQKDGVKIGIIGLTTPMSAKFEEDTGNLKEYKYVSIIEETKIVAGHRHQDVKSETINGVLITEPHRYGTVLSEIDLKFDVNDKTKKVKLLGKTATTTPVKNLEADKKVEEIYKPYHERLREIANEKIGETENDMVPQGKIHGVSISFAKDTGMSSFITDVEKYYSKADVVSFAYDYENVKLDKGDIKRKDIAYNYRYAGGDVSVYEMTGKQLKDYMEWAADYFDTIQKGDTNYRYNDVRGKSKYVTFDIFGGVSYKIDLRNQKGNKIVDLKLADGRKITPDMKLKVGMNSYRFDQLIKKGGIFEGQNIPLVWSSKDEMGQDKGRIQSMMIDYIKNVKGGKIDGKSHDRWEIIGL